MVGGDGMEIAAQEGEWREKSGMEIATGMEIAANCYWHGNCFVENLAWNLLCRNLARKLLLA